MKRVFVLLAVLIILGCGLKTTNCISDPERFQFQCFDAEKNKSFTRKPKRMTNWVCLSPEERFSFIESCNRGIKPPDFNICVIGDERDNFTFHCEEGEIPFIETGNFVCQELNDRIKSVEYCARKREEMKRKKK